MRAVVTLVFALAGGSLLYALAQQESEVSAPPAPRSLSATEHAPLPKDLSQYWLVPVQTRPSTRVRPDEARLARGVQAIEAGDFAAGLALVSSSNFDETALADSATYYRAVALAGLSRLAEADAALTTLTASAPHGYLNEVARMKLADVALARENGQRAEQILRALTSRTLMSPDPFLMLGRTEEALDHRVHAVDAYRKVYFDFPTSDRAVEAKAAIDRLEADGRLSPASFQDSLSRAERLFAARRWADARAAFESLVGAAAGNDKELASIRLAECDFHLGRHRAARDRLEPFLASSSRDAEARYFYVSAVRSMGDRAAYTRLARALVADHPTSPWAAETLNDLASRLVVEDQDEDADRVFRELLLRFPRHRHAERAAWKVGWAAYRSLQFAEVATVFESAAATFPRADYRPAWIYWSGRAREQMGDGRGAAARYQLVVADYGSSYYGRLASGRLASRPGSTVGATVQTVNAAAVGSAPPTEGVIRSLIAAGLFDDALKEVEFAQGAWGDSPRLQATVAWIRHQQGQDLRGDARFTALRGAITTMRRAYPQFLSAAGDTLPAEILGIIFPLDYWDLIDKYSRSHGLDPYLIAALMAQESTFTADIRSPANARGLMQVMPATGRSYARKLGIRRFTTGSLSQPETNVRIGVRYFKDLLDRFKAPHYALAAYNAGEGRVEEWIRDAPALSPDEFVDNIPFPETQSYVRRILGTAEDYRHLYGTGRLTPARLASAAD